MRWLLVLAIWATAGCITLLFAAGTSYGPTVVVLQQGLHGIHLGDLACAAASSVWAFATSRAALRKHAPR